MLKIAIADDHKLFAQGVANLLKEEDDFEVVGIFKNGRELLRFMDTNSLDVILTDMNMPGMDGMALIESLRSKQVKTKIIVLSMYDEEKIYKECVRLGVNAYVLKDTDPDELVYTIREVAEDRHIMNFQRVLRQMDSASPYDDSYKLKYQLSKREIEVLKLITDGKSNKEIAAILALSVYTVETHRKNIHQKLGVSNSIELLKKTQQMNL